ncbi:uncharacterized protein LOC143185625 [Calliopsis andreniformis]|uniref:uncharacterized protein LOC143185625 n=1 Tax=Calliopsis andreniformis TaxID=337506 RepID=UPI003FCC6938
MVLLIAGPPVEVGVTMYVLSISSVSEVLMVQFAFSNSYRTHIDSRPSSFVHVSIFLPLAKNRQVPPPPKSVTHRSWYIVARRLDTAIDRIHRRTYVDSSPPIAIWSHYAACSRSSRE